MGTFAPPAEDAEPESKEDDDQDEQEGSGEDTELALDVKVKPTSVIVIDGDDQVLRDRAIRASRTGKDDEGIDAAQVESDFQLALERYRVMNADEKARTRLSFFENTCRIETLGVVASLEFPQEEELASIQLYPDNGGRPFNYHPTAEEIEARVLQESQIELEREFKEKIKREAEEQKIANEEQERKRSDEMRYASLLKEEEELLEARSKPLREYLMKHVMPTLSQGLVECCRVQPDDPIDYLAEFLFKHTPSTGISTTNSPSPNSSTTNNNNNN